MSHFSSSYFVADRATLDLTYPVPACCGSHGGFWARGGCTNSRHSSGATAISVTGEFGKASPRISLSVCATRDEAALGIRASAHAAAGCHASKLPPASQSVVRRREHVSPEPDEQVLINPPDLSALYHVAYRPHLGALECGRRSRLQPNGPRVAAAHGGRVTSESRRAINRTFYFAGLRRSATPTLGCTTAHCCRTARVVRRQRERAPATPSRAHTTTSR